MEKKIEINFGFLVANLIENIIDMNDGYVCMVFSKEHQYLILEMMLLSCVDFMWDDAYTISGDDEYENDWVAVYVHWDDIKKSSITLFNMFKDNVDEAAPKKPNYQPKTFVN